MQLTITQLLVISLIIVLNTISNSQSASLEWANQIGGTTNDDGFSMTLDESGNVYVTGTFRGTVDFDPGPGIMNLTSNGYDDIFITKSDASGALIWVKQIGGPQRDFSYSIAVDALGNVYVTGTFSLTVDFDPGVGISNLTDAGGVFDIFVNKLDASGNFVWAKQITGPGQGTPVSVKVDLVGNVYTAGYFYGSIDFDPGVGVVNLYSQGALMSSDIFVSKLDSSGAFVWAKKIGEFNTNDKGLSMDVDTGGNVYTTGYFEGTADFDPDTSVYNLTASGEDIFVSKLDASGAFVWAKSFFGGTGGNEANFIKVDAVGNVYTTGYFVGTIDFDPDAGVANLTSAGAWGDIFVCKLDASGAYVWAKSMDGTSCWAESLALDEAGNVYVTGNFGGTIDFDPGIGLASYSSIGITDVFVVKLDALGSFGWAETFGGGDRSQGESIVIDKQGNVYVTGTFENTVDFDPSFGTVNFNSEGLRDIFILKMRQKGVLGHVYQDFNQSCSQDSIEIGLSNWHLIINPGNIITRTNKNGIWAIDSLPIGNYTITADTSQSNWSRTCPSTQIFTVVDPDSMTIAPSFGFISTSPCAASNISVFAPRLRPGFSNQRVNVRACNGNLGTGILNNAYVILELDSLLTPQSSSLAYTSLGNNLYRIDIGSIYPGFCIDFWLSCTVNFNTITGQTLCMNATLYPIDTCALDTIPNLYSGGFTPCISAYDQSHLDIDVFCNNGVINFTIVNNGSGDMSCYAPVRLYVDGVYMQLDSIQLVSADTASFLFAGDGRTWRMEVDQHPLHLGNSQPSATIELCGNPSNWTPNLFNIFTQDDSDSHIDIYCGQTTGSYDPNDKTGYPLGIGTNNEISANQALEYVIRFQNTGTDTAFTVVVRDTLSVDLDIFSVQSGTASHDYSFIMQGPRVLEWTFNNIMLADSNVNEGLSHGFITFKVNQVPNLPPGTIIENDASIYFDFNAPIITNNTQHMIALPQDLSWDGHDTITTTVCGDFLFNGFNYKTTGIYWQAVSNNGLDSLYVLNVTSFNSDSSFIVSSCKDFNLNGQIYSTSGTYTQTISNSIGCDSIITFNLTVDTMLFTTDSLLTESGCNSFDLNGQTYTATGMFTQTIPNSNGCDSTITLNLTIDTIDLSLTQNGLILFANGAGFSYQWVDCNNSNAPIPGATNNFYITPGNGSYAVEISTGNCTVTSNCSNQGPLGLLPIDEDLVVRVYPNPTTDILNIEKIDNNEIIIEMTNNLGQILISKVSNELITEIDMNALVSGIYYLSLRNAKYKSIQKVVKQ